MKVTFKRVEIVDAMQLSHLAETAYRPYYAYLWKEGGMDWYVQRSYNIAQLQSEIQDTNVEYWFVCMDAKPVGYIKFNLHSPMPNEPNEPALELQRIYFLPEAKGKGIGRLALEKAVQTAQYWGKPTVWLNVMDSADDARRVYEKWGFVPAGVQFLDFERLKPEFCGMIIMKKELSYEQI